MPLRMLMVGAGAVGGYFGGRLAAAGHDVTFLLRAGRATQIREHGLRLISPRGDLSLQPRMLSSDDLRMATNDSAYDVILVSTKSYSLAQAMEDFAPAVGPRTLILPLLNGMAHLHSLDERFGAPHVLGGSVRILATVLPGGEIEQTTKLSELTFGFRGDAPAGAPSIDELRMALTADGMDTIASTDVIGAMWQKWWLLAAMGAVCVLAGGSLGEARRTREGAIFNNAVLDETMAIATANGYPPREDLVREIRARFDDPQSTMTSSMYRDMAAGHPVEADQIVSDLILHAGNVPVPLLRAAYTRLQVYQARRSATKG